MSAETPSNRLADSDHGRIGSLSPLLGHGLASDPTQLRTSFRDAAFFPHIALDSFLSDSLWDGLRQEFPGFSEDHAKNEMGQVGHKAYHEDMRHLGPHFAQLDDLFRSPTFLHYLSELTAIPNLLYDPDYVGGGTHDNRDGAELDIHVDFNYHPSRRWHRRLNLILFMNEAWDASWGGCFQVHKNPWNRDENEFETFTPKRNRAVLFETSECSWHGFDRIQLPPDKKNKTRRTIAVYFYSEDRPAEQTAPDHATFYVPSPLPKSLQPDVPLPRRLVDEVRALVTRRDHQIRFLYDREMEMSDTVERVMARNHHLEAVVSQRVPLIGYARQRGQAEGVWDDLWLAKHFKVRLQAERRLTQLGFESILPEPCPAPIGAKITVAGDSFQAEVQRDVFRWLTPVDIPAGEEFDLQIDLESIFNFRLAGISPEDRNLGIKLEYLLAFDQEPAQ